MATFYRCDRCHAEQKERLSTTSIPRVMSDYVAVADTYDRELCYQCIRELNEWVKPQPKAAK